MNTRAVTLATKFSNDIIVKEFPVKIQKRYTILFRALMGDCWDCIGLYKVRKIYRQQQNCVCQTTIMNVQCRFRS